MEASVLSQETLKTIVQLFDVVSLKLTDPNDPLGEKNLERHKMLQAAYAEVVKYVEASSG
jgi:hypothetical protein